MASAKPVAEILHETGVESNLAIRFDLQVGEHAGSALVPEFHTPVRRHGLRRVLYEAVCRRQKRMKLEPILQPGEIELTPKRCASGQASLRIIDDVKQLSGRPPEIRGFVDARAVAAGARLCISAHGRERTVAPAISGRGTPAGTR